MAFDVETFLDQQYNQAASTEVPLPPEDVYASTVKDVGAQEVQTQNGPRTVMEVQHQLDGWDGPPIRQSIWLDLTQDGTGLDMSEGNNVQLGRLREAVGQNADGQPWSPRQLIGAALLVKVEHSQSKQDPNRFFANVTRVASLNQGREALM